MADTIVRLSKTYTAHDVSFDKISLRAPVYREIYMDGLGKPMDVTMTASGPLVVTHPQVVDEYLQLLIEEPVSYEMITQLSAVDALKLEKAVCGFFLDMTPSETSPTA